jgi:Cu/Ag efflux protein CusF
MNPLKLAVILAAAIAAPAHAQQPSPATDRTAHQVAQAKTDAALSEGEVRKVDKDAKKLTIRHGPLKNLDMPGMTMVFQVKDPAMLDRVKTGDKVRFNAEKAASGFIVTEIETVK